MNAIVLPAPGGYVSTRAQQLLAQIPAGQSEFSANVSGGFAVMSVKGKVFRIKHKGNETPIFRPGTMEPAASMTVVLVKANPQISKIFYEAGYQEGSAEAPDCWSANGVTPDASAAKKQSMTCAACPRNVWGSKINEATGKQGKECQDSRRIAIVPAAENYHPGADHVMRNETYDGPVLLRVPPASLGELVSYDQKVRMLGYPACAVVTRISFDYQVAYPKLKFEPVRLLGPDEDALLWTLREDPRVETILATEQASVPAATTAPALTTTTQNIAAIQAAALAQAQQIAQPSNPVPISVPVANVVQNVAASNPQFEAWMAAQKAPTVPPCPPGTDPAVWAAFQAQQLDAQAKAEEAKRAEEARQRAAQEAAEAAAWAAQAKADAEAKAAAEAAAQAATQAAAEVASPCPPGIDPAMWAQFQAMQAKLAQPAQVPPTAPATGAAVAAAKPRGRKPAASIPATSVPAAEVVGEPQLTQLTNGAMSATPNVDALLAGLNISG